MNSIQNNGGADRRGKSKGRKAIIVVLVLLVIAGFCAAGYFYVKAEEYRTDPQASQQAQKNRAGEVKEKVGKLISVPEDETPTLATVTDKDKLKDQPFFKDAQDGDVILIFPQAKKAIIYREDENRLINVGPIAITSDTQQGTTPEASSEAPATDTSSATESNQ